MTAIPSRRSRQINHHRRRFGIEHLEARRLLAGDTIVMFNDQVAGSGTNDNTTLYAANSLTSGLLKDIETGEATDVTLTVSAMGVTYDLITLAPAEGTDAFEVFDGFVDMSIGSNAAIRIGSGASYTHTFSGLDPQATYDFVGTAIRGDANAVAKWTKVALESAEAFTVDHSNGIGVVTDGLSNNEVALWTGDNRDEGFVIGWTNIRSGSDGTFSIVSQQYLGATPGVGTGNASGGANGYGLEAIRLTENSPNLKAISSTIIEGDRLVMPPTSFTVDFSSDLDVVTVDASDLTVDGVPAIGVTVVDVDTVTWTLPASLTAGDHILSIAEGAILSAPLAISLQAFDLTFAILGAPVVENLLVSNITPIAAIIGGTVTNAGGDDPALFVYWGDNDGGTDAAAWDHVVSLGISGNGQSQSALIESLTQLSTYYYRAFAQNSAGSNWADQTNSFTTPAAELPQIVTSPATSVAARSARLNGNVTVTGGDPPSVTLYYGNEDGGMSAPAWDFAIPLGKRAGAFSHFVTELVAETTYYYRVFAENMAGTVWSSTTTSFTTTANIPATVVINEIHYDPDDSMELVEFIELHNPSDFVVDLSEWRIVDAVDYTFPIGTTIPAGGYLTVTQNAAAFETKFGMTADGQWQDGDRLNNDGEVVELRDAAGKRIDRVDYQLGFPWPTTGAAGRSIELVNPFFENDIGGNWRGASGESDLPDTPETLLAAQSTWRYRKGNSEASNPADAWRLEGFTEDGTWLTGQTPIGYGDGDDITVLPDMRNNYSTVYLRNSFTLDEVPSALMLRVYVDDGAIVWINGQEIGRVSVSAGDKAFNATAANHETAWEEIIMSNTSALKVGENTIAVHGINATVGSSDMSIDVEVIVPGADAFVGTPTPNAPNSVFNVNVAPQMRKVDHSPQRPRSGVDVTVTVKVTDVDGVEDVKLDYQTVDPGSYIRLTDVEYQTAWTTVTMVDDGTGGDEAAGDDIYTVVLPGSLQTNRRLVRYRVTAIDRLAASITAPYNDDPQPNFVYFVYDGIPEWTGADEPGVTPEVTYGTDVTNSLPAFHLISREADVLGSQYNTAFNTNEFRFEGTLIVGDEVYDHIRYRIRGQNSTYVSGKNKWKLRFNRSHYFQGSDQYGTPWPEKLRTLNLGTNASPWAPGNRGLAGMDEAIAFKLWNMVGVAAPNVSALQLRVIDSADEASPTNQYEGDLWGLYLAFENPERQFVQAHGLPDGNLFRMQAGNSELESHGFGLPGDLSDLNTFTSSAGYNLSPTQPIDWWRDNVDLDAYYSYRSVVEAVNHSDIRDRENMLLFFNPETGKWSMLPWDVDLLYEEFDRWGPDGVQNASALEKFRRALLHDELNIEFQNRARELQDLLLNADQGADFIEEYARHVEPFAAIDRAMWDYNPRSSTSPANRQHRGAFYNEVYTYPAGNGAAGEVRRAISPVGFEGMVNWVKEFISLDGFGGGQLAVLHSDPAIPATPTVTFMGAAGFSADDLCFQTSEFSDPQGNQTFAAIEWRVGEVTDESAPGYDPAAPQVYELTSVWGSGENSTFASDVQIPGSALEPGHAYRARVRMQDSSGRWSDWSEAVQFIVTPAEPPATTDIVITEINYNPAEPGPDELDVIATLDSNDFEFIEVQNINLSQTINLENYRFTDGVDFTFGSVSLGPGDRALIVEDVTAFEVRYGASLNVIGEWSGGLAGGGEKLTLVDGDGRVLVDISYDDTSPWPVRADGVGATLELINPTGISDAEFGKHYSWRGSTEVGGTPGTSGVGPIGIVINEVMANTDASALDSIELYNASTDTINLSGWYLSDSANDLRKFEIPAGTMLGSGEYIVFDENDFNPNSTSPGPGDFALNGSQGDDVWLVITGSDNEIESFVDDVHFGATLLEESLGRVPNGVGRLAPQSRRTLGCGNAHARVGPLVISEINYNPGAPSAAALAVDMNLISDDLEFVEIYNGTNSTVNLTDWHIRGGVDYDFDVGATIGAERTIVVVSFNPDNPNNASRVAAFRDHYGIDAGVTIIGGYDGQLSNSGERVELERPDIPIGFPTVIPQVTEDELVYDDLPPWGTSADGVGNSLNRRAPVFHGPAAASWRATVPTPGFVVFAGNVDGDFTGDGSVDANDIDVLLSADNAGSRATYFDLDGDLTLDDTDVAFLVEGILDTALGDVNLDGMVDGMDFNSWNDHKFQSCTTWSTADLNGDGVTDVSDFNIWNENKFMGANAAPAEAGANVPRAPFSARAMPADVFLRRFGGNTVESNQTRRSSNAVDSARREPIDSFENKNRQSGSAQLTSVKAVRHMSRSRQSIRRSSMDSHQMKDETSVTERIINEIDEIDEFFAEPQPSY